MLLTCSAMKFSFNRRTYEDEMLRSENQRSPQRWTRETRTLLVMVVQ